MQPVRLFLIVLAALCLSGFGARAETRVALVIGNSAYQHTTPLTHPAGDARAVGAALRRLGFTVVEGRDLTRTRFAETLADFSAHLQNTDTALVFYAGHSLQLGEENWLIPVDAQVSSDLDLELNAIPLSAVLRTLEKSARVRLIILDASQENPMAAQITQGGRPSPATRGLARVEAGVGTLIAYSAQPGSLAPDSGGAHSPFAGALLDLMEERELEIRQMLTQVRAKVIAQTGRKQVPWDHSALTGNVYLAAAASPTAAGAGSIYASRNTACKRGQERIEQRFVTRVDASALAKDAAACLASGKDALAWGTFLRGVSRDSVGDFAAALADFNEAIALRPDFADAYFMRSSIYEMRGEKDRMTADFAEALRLSPDNGRYLSIRAAYLVDAGEIAAALDHIERALASMPDDIFTLYTAGYLRVNMRDLKGAMQAGERLITLAPKSHYGYFVRGLVYVEKGDKPLAEADLTRAVELSDRSEVNVLLARAQLYSSMGRHDAAQADLLIAYGLDPSNQAVLKAIDPYLEP